MITQMLDPIHLSISSSGRIVGRAAAAAAFPAAVGSPGGAIVSAVRIGGVCREWDGGESVEAFEFGLWARWLCWSESRGFLRSFPAQHVGAAPLHPLSFTFRLRPTPQLLISSLEELLGSGHLKNRGERGIEKQDPGH